MFVLFLITVSLLGLVVSNYFIGRKSVDENKILLDVRGSLVPFELSWNEVNGLVVSGILESGSVNKDETGDYMDLAVNGKKVRAYFRNELPAVSLLQLDGGKYLSRQVWKAVAVGNLEPYLNKGAQVVLYSTDTALEEFNSLQSAFENDNAVAIQNITHVTVRR